MEQEYLGRTENFLQVKLPKASTEGDIINMEITGYEDKYLNANFID